jgi:predicted nucleic-acid-binding protein
MLLETEQMQVEGRDRVRRTLAEYREGPGDFADYLIGNGNQGAGCTTTATFDRKLKDHPAFALLR